MREAQFPCTSTVTMEMTTETATKSSPAAATPPVELNVDFFALMVIGIVGTLGNGAVILALGRKEYRKKLSNLLLINQSLIDCASNVILIATTLSRAVPKSYSTAAGMFVCYIFDSSSLVNATVGLSTGNLVLITMERYLMVVAPVFHRNRATKKSTLVAIAVTTLVHLLIRLPLSIPYTGVINGQCVLRLYMSMRARDVNLIAYSIVYLYGPVALFLITYPHMFYCLRKHTSVRVSSEQNKTKPLSKHELNLILVSVTITVAYVLCYAPVYLGYTLVRAGAVSPSYVGSIEWQVFNYLLFTNNVLNPILYAFSYNDFKKGFYKTFKIKLGRKAVPGEDTKTSDRDANSIA